MDSLYQIGKLVFALSGEDKVLPHLKEELARIKTDSSKKPALRFNFGKVSKDIPGGIYVSPVVCNEHEVLYHGNGFLYRITENDGVLQVNIQSNSLGRKQTMFPGFFKVLDWNFLLPTEQLAKSFMYAVFDYLTQIQNLNAGQSYMHASSFTKDDRTVAIVAWGGIGKTTSMLKLITEDNWKFLSDDLGIIDENGIIYRSPKKMQIYAYNLVGEPKLKKMLLEGRGLTDMLNWHYRKAKYGIKKVRRRVSAEELFKDAVGVSEKLTDVFFIERAAVKDFESHAISIDELAGKAASTVMSEIDPFHKIAAAVYSVQTKSIIPSYPDVFERTRHMLSKAFSNVSPVLIKIPLNASPDQLAEYLRKLLK